MSVVLDSGGVSALAGDRALVDGLLRRGEWPPDVPVVVLTESLSGDHRRDHATDRVLSLSVLHDVEESLSRRAAGLRFQCGDAGSVSAVDAVVVALAEEVGASSVLTSDPLDIKRLAAVAGRAIRVVTV